MVEKRDVLIVLKEWFEYDLPELVKREISYRDFLDIKEVLGLIGVRRAGKTFFMFQTIKELIEAGILKSNILYINFEDRRLYPLTAKTLDLIHETFVENFDFEKRKKLYLFFDEIQNVPEWERFVRNMYDKNNMKFFISGSSSKVLSSYLSTLLTGRIIKLEMYPFSFREFLIARGFKKEIEDKLIFFSPKIHEIKRLQKEYLIFGSFPEVVISKNENVKKVLLKEYLDGIIQRDVIARNRIKNTIALENFAQYLFSSVSFYFSFSKAANSLKSLGIKVGKQTLLQYFSYLSDAFLFFKVPIFSFKVKDVLQYPVKIYCVDNGLVNVATTRFSEDLGRLMENAVFIELKRRGKEVYYWKSRAQEEVDFAIKEGLKIRQLIQVCWNVEEEKTKKREIKALLKAMEEFKLKEGLVLTEDYEGTEEYENKKINFVPLVKWLLS